MKSMKRMVGLGLFLLIYNVGSCDPQLSSEDFLAKVRRPRMSSTWAKLKGYVEHRRKKVKRDGKVIQKKMNAEVDIEVGILFKSDIVTGELLFDNNEHYEFSQVFASGIEGAVSRKTGCRKGNTEVMNSFNISASDISLSFLYWDFVKEHPTDRLVTMKCRVLELKNDGNKETVRVWIHPGWLAPLKAQWFKLGADTPYRTAEFTEVTPVGKDEDIQMIKKFEVYGDSWNTMVTFEELKAEKTDDEPIPENLFPKL